MKVLTLAFSLASLTKNDLQHAHSTGGQPQEMRRYPSLPAFISPLYSTLHTVDESPSLVNPSSDSLVKLSHVLGASPQDLLRLQTSQDGVRGVYLNRDISQNNIILKLPLASCLRDDAPPAWFVGGYHGDAARYHHTSGAWATRLAAALIDVQLHPKGYDEWLKLLPNANYLRASLPIHWSEETIATARCSALELAVDSAYFARADAIGDLLPGLQEKVPNLEQKELERMCNNALDVVQTRSCRVDLDGAPVRLLAPIFDFINHASSKSTEKGSANAAFSLEGNDLVVRALVDLNADEEVLIDYGESARPSWRCLASYGFIPEYPSEQDEDDNVAELWVSGVRYDVGPSTVPVDLVEAIQSSNDLCEEASKKPEAMLTPDVALRIAERASDVAFQLLLDQDAMDDDCELQDKEIDEEMEQNAADVISERLAASLRWSQHRTLRACAAGLREWTARQSVER